MNYNKSRYLYTFKKIIDDEKKILVAYLDTICYTCDITFAYHNINMESEGDSIEELSQKSKK